MTTTARCVRCDAFKPLKESRVTTIQVSVDGTPVPSTERICYACLPSAPGDWRVVRRLSVPSTDEDAGMAYRNVGPYATKEDAREARASMIAAEAIYSLRHHSSTHASALLMTLLVYYRDDTINVGDVSYAVFQL